MRVMRIRYWTGSQRSGTFPRMAARRQRIRFGKTTLQEFTSARLIAEDLGRQG